MLIATFVKCLSYLLKNYISFKCLCYHSDHEQIWQILLDKDILLTVDNLCKEHKFSYQTCGHQIAEGLKDTFGKHIVKQVHLLLQISIWKCRLFC